MWDGKYVQPPRLVTPRPWAGPVAIILILTGGVFAFLLYRLSEVASASAGGSYEVPITAADVLLLGGGALSCWAAAAVLLIWRRRSR